MDIETLAIEVIANAGDSKSSSFEAIQAAKDGDFALAHELLEKSRRALVASHEAHTQILENEAQGKQAVFPFLAIHASNTFSAAELAWDFSDVLVDLIKTGKTGKGG